MMRDFVIKNEICWLQDFVCFGFKLITYLIVLLIDKDIEKNRFITVCQVSFSYYKSICLFPLKINPLLLLLFDGILVFTSAIFGIFLCVYIPWG